MTQHTGDRGAVFGPRPGCRTRLRMPAFARSLRLRCFSLAWLLGASLLTAARAASPVAPCAGDGQARHWADRLNDWRLQAPAACSPARQAPALRWDDRLAASASAQAADLARRATLSHQDGLGLGLPDRLRHAGYRLARAAENLALGSPDFEATLALWRASRAHCENLMEPAFTDVAVACAERPGEPESRVWVLQLGRPLPP